MLAWSERPAQREPAMPRSRIGQGYTAGEASSIRENPTLGRPNTLGWSVILKKTGQNSRTDKRAVVSRNAIETAGHHLNFETRSACSRITRALSSTSVPVGSPLYMTRGLDQ